MIRIRMRGVGATRIAAQIAGLSDEKFAAFSEGVVVQAKANASAMAFDESTGELASKIDSSKLGAQRYRIETSSGHASYIEFGTRFIEGKMPFLWPAYRKVKKAFMRGKKWV